MGQEDTIAVESIRLATSVSGSDIAVSRATLACITPQYKTYLETQLRVGDSIVFYAPTLSNIIQSAALVNNQAKRDFTTALIGKSLPILAVKRYKPDPETNQWLPTTSDPNLTDSTVD